MSETARTRFRFVMTGARAVALGIAMLAGQTPSGRAAPAVAGPSVAPTVVQPQPVAAMPAPATSATAPTAPSSSGVVRAPVQLNAPAIPLTLIPAIPASIAPAPRTLLRDAALLTGRRYTRTLVVPSSGTIQVIAELRGSCDARLSLEPTSVTGGARLSADLLAPAENRRHAATLVGQRMLREYQVTTTQVANGGNFIVSITPVGATPGRVPGELSFEINLK